MAAFRLGIGIRLRRWSGLLSSQVQRGPRLLGRNLFIVVFFAVQIVLPLRGCVSNRLESRGAFSWNMFSHRYRCDLDYRLIDPDGGEASIDHRRVLPWKKSVLGEVFNLSRLPRYHAYLCERAETRGALGEIRARAGCQLDQGPVIEITDPGLDICTADNLGVIRSLDGAGPRDHASRRGDR